MPNYYHDLMTGAPTLNGLAGSLIAVLDACLVDGFGLQTATVSVTDGVATLTTPAAHPFALHQRARVTGATNALLNADHVVTARTSTTITFAAPGVPNGAAAGSISVLVAPAGWTKPFAGTNVAVYRNSAVLGTGLYLRVDDTAGTTARVIGYETMSDLSTGEAPFPSGSQISGGGWWGKASGTASTARAWTVVADPRTFYLHLHPPTNSTGDAGTVRMFGDVASLKTGDAYAAVLLADLTAGASLFSTTSAPAAFDYTVNTSAHVAVCYAARSHTGISGAQQCAHAVESFGVGGNNASGMGYGPFTTYPNPVDNGLLLSRKQVLELTGIPAVRGIFRGGYLTPQICHASFSRFNVIDGAGDLAGRNLLAVKCGNPLGTTSTGVVFFDITGPW